MKQLITNITGIYGNAGKQWLQRLPTIVNELAQHWCLSDIMPVDNMTYNYVAMAMTDAHLPVVLKISCDAKTSYEEMRALHYFNGDGSVQLFAVEDEYHAMLLQRAIPGTTLKTLYPQYIEEVMDIYITVTKKLHDKQLPARYEFRHVRDWLQTFRHVDLSQLSADMVAQTKEITAELLSSMRNKILLHGDLHHDNVIQHQNEWLAIDPKGIVGDAEFEIAAFDIIHPSEFHLSSKITDLFTQRINLLAQKSDLDAERIKNWVFVRLILSAAWSIEDNTEIGPCIDLANALLPLMNK